jgi:hypothetical protein
MKTAWTCRHTFNKRGIAAKGVILGVHRNSETHLTDGQEFCYRSAELNFIN